MSTTIKLVCGITAAALLCSGTLAADKDKAVFGFGSTPTNSELQKFISPLPDGRGLPPGSGSVAQGKSLYHEQCAACHGDNLQGGIGDKLVGGRGTLVNDNPAKAPVKTVESYWPYATTLFDYVKRAMPFYSPGSLTDDQVYAVTAYILSEAKIVGPDAVLDAGALAKVIMPNQGGFIPDPRPEKFPSVASSPHQDLKMVVPTR